MPKYRIAEFVVEYNAKLELTQSLSEPFLYNGNKPADLQLNVTDEQINELLSRMSENSTPASAENFAYSNAFNKLIIKHKAMLIHSSAIVYNGKAVLFSAPSQTGKSTHTKLWKNAFGDDVTYINDDKPVVKLTSNGCIVYGTPFDGGSGIANNISAPLKSIVFIEQAQENSISKLKSTTEILQRLYFSTVHCVDKSTAEAMLGNFEFLIANAEFYLLKCNTDISSAHLARKELFAD